MQTNTFVEKEEVLTIVLADIAAWWAKITNNLNSYH